jgi:hypothetical protein
VAVRIDKAGQQRSARKIDHPSVARPKLRQRALVANRKDLAAFDRKRRGNRRAWYRTDCPAAQNEIGPLVRCKGGRAAPMAVSAEAAATEYAMNARRVGSLAALSRTRATPPWCKSSRKTSRLKHPRHTAKPPVHRRARQGFCFDAASVRSSDLRQRSSCKDRGRSRRRRTRSSRRPCRRKRDRKEATAAAWSSPSPGTRSKRERAMHCQPALALSAQ